MGCGGAIAMDLEADNQHHYVEQICLIQLNVGGEQWLVDPLAGLDPGPLLEVLSRRDLILHGGDYDLRLLGRGHGFRPKGVFDTMLAAQLLGWSETGLRAVARRTCGVALPKDGQRANWSRRPLTEELIEYAANDTRYLGRIEAGLRAQLEEAGRLEWHRESCRRLVAQASDWSANEPAEAWRIKGSGNIEGLGAAVLKELWMWREEMARQRDRPPFKVASGKFLLHWANWAAQGAPMAEGARPERPKWLKGSMRAAFDAALDRALSMPEAHWPCESERAQVEVLERSEKAMLKRLMKARDRRAQELGLDPGVLGPRQALKELVRHREVAGRRRSKASGLMAWQLEILWPEAERVFRE